MNSPDLQKPTVQRSKFKVTDFESRHRGNPQTGNLKIVYQNRRYRKAERINGKPTGATNNGELLVPLEWCREGIQSCRKVRSSSHTQKLQTPVQKQRHWSLSRRELPGHTLLLPSALLGLLALAKRNQRPEGRGSSLYSLYRSASQATDWEEKAES